MSLIHAFARKVRHAPGLRKLSKVWDVIRPVYHQLLDWRGKGVPLNLSGEIEVRIPPRFLNIIDWEHYEPETMRYFVDHIRKHPEINVLDMGCSLGIFTAAALFASNKSQVVAWDGDISSIQCLISICHHATRASERLYPVHAFASEKSSRNISWESVQISTRKKLGQISDGFKSAGYKYLSSTTEGQDGVPVYSIDDVLLLASIKKSPWFFKCDIEGAELLALRGAEGWITKNRPWMLLSVHPGLMKTWGHTPEDVRKFLESHNYSIKKIDEYYDGAEQSWWCEPLL